MIIGLSRNAWGFEKWTTTDYTMEAAFLGLLVVDYAQTKYIVKHPYEYHETNPILGNGPSMRRVNAYFALSALTHVGIAYVLPHPYRNYWQVAGCLVELGCVGNNIHCGIRCSF